MKINNIIFLSLFFFITACHNTGAQKQTVSSPDGNKLIEMNRYIITKDRELIISYCERKGITASETPTGLWYSVKSPGSGQLIKEGDIVKFEYDCSLLDGTLCYSSKGSEPKTTRVGFSTIESGLLEGLKLMRPGSEFVFIIPPYLAHGIPGDGYQIPGRSVIVYRIKILP
jgi:FKBP-type peptidyl-prolyl cis-trans isomerase FkpA